MCHDPAPRPWWFLCYRLKHVPMQYQPSHDFAFWAVPPPWKSVVLLVQNMLSSLMVQQSSGKFLGYNIGNFGVCVKIPPSLPHRPRVSQTHCSSVKKRAGMSPLHPWMRLFSCLWGFSFPLEMKNAVYWVYNLIIFPRRVRYVRYHTLPFLFFFILF